MLGDHELPTLSLILCQQLALLLSQSESAKSEHVSAVSPAGFLSVGTHASLQLNFIVMSQLPVSILLELLGQHSSHWSLQSAFRQVGYESHFY